MPTAASATTVAVMVALAGTFAILAFAFLWAITSNRPVRVHAPLTGRAAANYRYSPTRLQDELGLTAVAAPQP